MKPLWLLTMPPIKNAIISVFDHWKDPITPALGSVVYCDLAFGYIEHSGIYTGGGQIAHMNRHGCIELVTPDAFMQQTTARRLYVSAAQNTSCGEIAIAAYARSMVGSVFRYNLIRRNCHWFSASCLLGHQQHSIVLLRQLQSLAKERLGTTSWHPSAFKSRQQRRTSSSVATI